MAPYGDDANAGNCDKPVASLQVAVNKSRETGIRTIWIRGGRYFFDQTVSLDGTDNDLLISAFENEKVIFDGGLPLNPNGFAPITTNLAGRSKDEMVGEIFAMKVWDSKLDILLSKPNVHLSMDDKLLHFSRYPNEGYVRIDTATIDISIENGEGNIETPAGAAFKLSSEFTYNKDAWEAEIQRNGKVAI